MHFRQLQAAHAMSDLLQAHRKHRNQGLNYRVSFHFCKVHMGVVSGVVRVENVVALDAQMGITSWSKGYCDLRLPTRTIRRKIHPVWSQWWWVFRM